MATAQQIQLDIQNELVNTNQLLRLISVEIQKIKQITRRGGQFETTIEQNESLVTTLASMQQIDLENLPPVTRMHVDLNDSNGNQNLSYEQHETFREDSNMDESQ